MRKRINWQLVARNLADAREHIEETERQIAAGKRPIEAVLQIQLEHAYHHINFAWNARYASVSRNRSLSDADFNKWGRFPKKMKPLYLAPRRAGVRSK